MLFARGSYGSRHDHERLDLLRVRLGFHHGPGLLLLSTRSLWQEAGDRRRGRRTRAVGFAHRADPGRGRQRHRPGQLPALPGQGRGQRRRRLHDPLLRAPSCSWASR
ncbi:MAG: hypothetical protein MZU79_04340 [Anaerotruncus sp.]|nr:hypothetical protein [Anaerotruncus sp.]